MLNRTHPALSALLASLALVAAAHAQFLPTISPVPAISLPVPNAATTTPTVSITPGLLSTIAGTGVAGNTGNNAAATLAKLNGPTRIIFDAAGNLYFADTSNHEVRKITPAGIISVFAGKGTSSHTGDGGPATSATISLPRDLAIDSKGNIFIVEAGFNCIRRVDAVTGNISTYAGVASATAFPDSGNGGPATSAYLFGPRGLVVDTAGNLYIASYQSGTVRVVNTSGVISLVAGTAGIAGTSGDGGPATSATLNQPYGLGLDSAGSIYIADFGSHDVRKVDAKGIITLVAGTEGTAGYTGDGKSAKSATLSAPRDVKVDAGGNVYIGDAGNSVVRKVDTAGIITTIAGTHVLGYTGDGGIATAGALNTPFGVALDAQNNLYIADSGANVLRKVSVGSGLIAFPTQQSNTVSAVSTVTVSNTGGAPLQLAGLAVSDPTFTLVPSGQTDCTATTTLAPGASCGVGVTFTPLSAISYTAAITLTDNAGGTAGTQQTIKVTGTGVLKTTGSAVKVTLTSTPAAYAVPGTAVTVSASVAGVAAGSPSATGIVQFLSGTTLLGSAPLDGSGNASFPLGSNLPLGVLNITAVYSGDVNYRSGTASLPIAIQNDFMLALSSTSAETTGGGSVTTTLTLTPTGISPGAFTLGCVNQPAYITCSFSPATLPASASPATSVLTITSTRVVVPYPAGIGATGALLLLLLPLNWRSKASKRHSPLRWPLAALLLLMALGSVSGCSSGSSTAIAPFPVAFQITATSGQATHTVPYTLNLQ